MRTFETMNDGERKLWLNEHFFYEIQMMNGAIYRLPPALREEIDPQLKTNFILDLFLLHARNLIEFFYKDHKNNPDDAFALQFIEKDADWEKLINEKEAFLKEDIMKKRAHKQLAHLTYSRIEGTPPEKALDCDRIYIDIMQLVKLFIDKLPAKYLDFYLIRLKEELSSSP